MTRAPLVMAKAEAAFQRSSEIYDTTIGWRFINPLMKAQYGDDSMPETGENVAEEFQVSRADQDAFALRSQQRARRAREAGALVARIVPVKRPAARRERTLVGEDEHPRHDTTLEGLAKLKPIVRPGGTVTAGNASGVNDGAQALIVASAEAAKKHGLTPIARILGMATAGVPPAYHGHRADTGDAETALAARPHDRRLRPDRAQRGLRQQALACLRGPGHRGRRRLRQSERRRYRVRPPARHVGGAASPRTSRWN